MGGHKENGGQLGGGGRGRPSGLQQLAEEAEVEDLELLLQVHADDPVLPVDAEQDPGGFTVLPQDHLYLQGVGGQGGISWGQGRNGGERRPWGGGGGPGGAWRVADGLWGRREDLERSTRDHGVVGGCVGECWGARGVPGGVGGLYLVALGGGDGLQVLAGDAHHLLAVLQVDGAHPALRAQNRGSQHHHVYPPPTLKPPPKPPLGVSP